MGVGQAVGDRHQHGSGCAVPRDIGDQHSPAALGQLEEIVIVASRAPGGRIVGGELHGGDFRQGLRQQRPLDIRNDLELLIHRVVGGAQLLGQHQVVRGPPEQIAGQHLVGKIFTGECRRFLAHQHHHVERLAPVIERQGDKRALVGEMLGGGIVRGDLQVIDDPRFVPPDQFAEQTAR
jgi:hypothetical protein